MSELPRIYLEVGSKRAFAAALDWPGWCRAGKTPDAAIETLLEAGGRYKRTVGAPAKGLRIPKDPDGFVVVEKVRGDATTDFGAPSKEVSSDSEPMHEAEAKMHERLLKVCWRAFDKAAAGAVGVELRKGPRGGGRALDKIVEHVHEADGAYLRGLGFRPPKTHADDPDERMAALRDAILTAFRSRAKGEPPEVPPRKGKRWSPRYFVRRSAWHAIDHVWEIEDRSTG